MKFYSAILSVIFLIASISGVEANRSEKLKKEIIKREIAKEKEKQRKSTQSTSP